MRTISMQLNEPSYCRERVFPEDCSQYGGSRPYDTILKGVKTLAEWLYEHNCKKVDEGVDKKVDEGVDKKADKKADKEADKKVSLNNKVACAASLLNIDMCV